MEPRESLKTDDRSWQLAVGSWHDYERSACRRCSSPFTSVITGSAPIPVPTTSDCISTVCTPQATKAQHRYLSRDSSGAAYWHRRRRVGILAIGGFAPKSAPPPLLGTLGLLLFLYGIGVQYDHADLLGAESRP